ncbi:MAG: hypothetical protein NTV51_17480, partial [Verrucomicrobia bacterium]|nr:hypothetical protein [Verrucomicrobiota bacterium]
MRSFRFLAALCAAPLFAATAPNALLDQVITLPEFQVFENRPLPLREKWSYAKVGNFEILSNTSERTTKRFAKDLSEFQIVLGIIAPEMLIKAEQPVMVVLCGKNSQFERFQVKSVIAPTRGQVTSLVRDSEIASIVVDFETRSVDETDAVPLAVSGGESWFSRWFSRDINTTDEFIRQYIHLSLSQLSPRPPAWVAEGLANIYSSIEYNNKWIEIGLPKSFINEVTSYSTGGYGMGGYTSNGFAIGPYGGGYGGSSGDYYSSGGSPYYGN